MTYQSRQNNPVIGPKSDSLDGPRPESSNDSNDGKERKDGAQYECRSVNLTHGASDRYFGSMTQEVMDGAKVLGRMSKG